MGNKTPNKDIRRLCPNCKTGRDTYLLDDRSPFCHYLGCHTGTTCAIFVPIFKNERRVSYEHRKKYENKI